MAVEAVRACQKGRPSEHVSHLTFASTTAPFADLQNASQVSMATGLGNSVRSQDSGGSTRAGLSALINALESNTAGDAVVVASDCRRAKPGSVQEMHYAAGAAALQISTEENAIARCLGTHSNSNLFIDHYRINGSNHDYYWEERWIRDEGYLKVVPKVVIPLLEKAGITADQINHFCLPGYMPRLNGTVAKRLGIAAEAVVDNLAAEVGDTGTPQALLMLIKALDEAQVGDKILVVGFGAGCDALLFEATANLVEYQQNNAVTNFSTSRPAVEHYNQLLSFQGDLKLDWGIRSETDNRVAFSQLNRAQDQVTGFNAGVCPNCQAVQFPVLSTCVSCGSTEPVSSLPLADEAAKVATFTSDALQYYPAPPMYWGLVQFDNGARLLMEMVEVNPKTFDTGTSLRMMYRIKQQDEKRGLHRYFWKAAPVEEAASTEREA